MVLHKLDCEMKEMLEKLVTFRVYLGNEASSSSSVWWAGNCVYILTVILPKGSFSLFEIAEEWGGRLQEEIQQ